MSSVYYTKIFGRNFSSFGEFELKISPGKHLIIGENSSSNSATSNGSGKSSLFNSLVFSQYKSVGDVRDPSRNYNGDCLTGLEFEKNGNRYRVERYWKDNKHGSCLKLFCDDEELSHRKSVSNEEELQQLIGIPHDVFVSSVVVMQGLPINFSNFTPTVRKTIMEDMLGFQVWDRYKAKFSTWQTGMATNLTAASNDFNSSKVKMANIHGMLETQKRMLAEQQQDITNQIHAVKTQYAAQYEILEATREQCKQQEQKLTALGDHSALSLASHTLSSRAKSLEQLLSTGNCPECGQLYPQSLLAESQTELNHIQQKLPILATTLAELEQERLELASRSRKFDENNVRYRELKSTLEYLVSQSQNPASEEDLKKLEDELSEWNMKVNVLSTEVQMLQQSCQHIQYLHGLLLPSSTFRSSVLEKYISYLNTVIDSITPLVFEDVVLELAITSNGKGVDLLIRRGDKKINYGSLSGGERRRLDIIIILSFQRFLLESSGITTNLLVFDEIFDGLDRQGVESVLACIDNLFPEEMSIYVITHNDDLKSLFSSVIRVVKEENISRLAEGGDSL